MRLLPLSASTTLLVIAIAAVPATIAQTATPAPHVGTSPPIVAYGFAPAGGSIPPKPHAPFSAVLVQRMEQTLADGTSISRDMQEIVMRDSAGRIYRERSVKRPGSDDVQHTTMTIVDPVRHVQYVCSSFRRGCMKMEYREHPSLLGAHGRPSGSHKDITEEDLGTSTIDGIEVEGKRRTWEIPEGAVGNDRPIASSEEIWHSKELDVDVQVKRTDPRSGTRTNSLTEIKIGEPDPKYFQVPEGYRVDVRRGPSGMLSPLPTESERTFPAGTLPPNR